MTPTPPRASDEDVERVCVAIRHAIIEITDGDKNLVATEPICEDERIIARAAIAAMPRQTTEADAREILATLLHEAGDISGAIHVREGSCRQINSRVALAAICVAQSTQSYADGMEDADVISKVQIASGFLVDKGYKDSASISCIALVDLLWEFRQMKIERTAP